MPVCALAAAKQPALRSSLCNSLQSEPALLDFARFAEAQSRCYEQALGELRAGKKRSHWMWFIFPQIAGLGASAVSQRFAIASLDEAQAYLSHPLLGDRLLECAGAVLVHKRKSVKSIFGTPDWLKFHASMTLFHRARVDEPLFQQALHTFFNGEPHGLTEILLKGRTRAG